MTIEIYKNTSARNVVNKSITLLKTYSTAEIKEKSSIIDPVIIIPNFTGVLSGNYMYIQEFGRYYYINNIEVEHQRIIIYGHTDVLKSFAAEIKTFDAILQRVQQDHYNMYLSDKAFKTLQYKRLETHAFRGTNGEAIGFTKDFNYVLVLGGGGR